MWKFVDKLGTIFVSFSTVLIHNITAQQNHVLSVFVSKIKMLKMSRSEIRLCSKKLDAVAASFTVPHIFFYIVRLSNQKSCQCHHLLIHAHTTLTFVSWKVVSSVYTDRARLIWCFVKSCPSMCFWMVIFLSNWINKNTKSLTTLELLH